MEEEKPSAKKKKKKKKTHPTVWARIDFNNQKGAQGKKAQQGGQFGIRKYDGKILQSHRDHQGEVYFIDAGECGFPRGINAAQPDREDKQRLPKRGWGVREARRGNPPVEAGTWFPEMVFGPGGKERTHRVKTKDAENRGP